MRKRDDPAVPQSRPGPRGRSSPPYLPDRAAPPFPSEIDRDAIWVVSPARAGGIIEVSVPADRTSLEILRTMVGRAARIAGFSYDGIEDFSMAVDEAATLLVESKPTDLLLTLSGMRQAGRLEVLLTARQPTTVLSPVDLAAEYRWDVLFTFCEEVWWEEPGVSIGLAQSPR